MGDKGSKDKGKKGKQKKAQHTLKEKRKLNREKKVLRGTARYGGKRLLGSGLSVVGNKYQFLGVRWRRRSRTNPPLGLDRGARPSRLCHRIGLQYTDERPMRRRRRRGSSAPFDDNLFNHCRLPYASKVLPPRNSLSAGRIASHCS